MFLGMTSMMKAEKETIERIDPTDWYAGMRNPQLQLMVYGQDITTVEQVTTDYPGVTIDRLVRLDSPNYLLVYLNLEGARPGRMSLVFEGHGWKTAVYYTLKKREMTGDKRVGFSNADVLYLLMPDRFAQGTHHCPQVEGMAPYREDRSLPSLRHGGDLEGIMEHLDYFTELGVTAVWLTPVLENNAPDSPKGHSSYHGYATTDYYHVDPRLGSNDDYRQLVDAAHRHGLKIVMDMVFNHCGLDHPWVKDKPSKDWFNPPLQTSYKLTPVKDPYASMIDLRETVEGWFVPSMPDLNLRNPHVMTYLIQNSFWWIETIGIDGIRMDTYPYADAKAMARWMKELDEEYPNFNTVGETWVTEPAYTAAWQKDSRLSEENSFLKTVMDFSFYDKINHAKHEETDAWWNGLNRIYHSFVYDFLYPNPSSVMAFIDNHDTDRFLGNGCDTLALKQALALLMTVNRIPQLYYGTEILMNGTTTETDGHVRKDFPGGFPNDSHNAFTPKGRSKEEQEMFRWTSRLLHWRHGNDAIIKGKMTQFIPYEGVYVIARQYHGKSVLTVLNGTGRAATMHIQRYAEVIGNSQKARNVLTGRHYSLTKDIRLRPRQSLVLEY